MTQPTLERILYVEDDPDVQKIVKIALESVGGFKVKICSSGAEALQQAPLFEPQLILLDVMMPIMDGPATLKNLRNIPSMALIPVLFVTAKVQKYEVENYKKLGVLEVIRKPFDPITLSETIQNIWRAI